jgi:hypothetical protein
LALVKGCLVVQHSFELGGAGKDRCTFRWLEGMLGKVINSQDMRRRYEIWQLSVMVMGFSVRICYMLVFVFKFFMKLNE